MSSYYNQGVQVIVGNGQNFPGTPRISLIPFIQNAYDKGLLNFTVLPPGSISLAEIENIATSKILGRSTAGSGVIEQISIGTGLSLSGGTLSSTVTATPGGSDTQIQYNNAGVFGGSSQLIANIGTTNTLDIQGSGSTSATNALRVRNSAGTQIIAVQNDSQIRIDGNIYPTSQAFSIGRLGYNDYLYGSFNSGGSFLGAHPQKIANGLFFTGGTIGNIWANNDVNFRTDAINNILYMKSSSGYLGMSVTTPLAAFHNNANTTASTPSMLLSGTGYSGGTSTTTKPTFLIEPTGTTSTGWSTSGTKLGVNAETGFTGNLLDLQVNGVSFMSILSGGTIIRNNASAYRNNTVNGSFYFDAGTIVIRDGNSGDTNVKLALGSLTGTAHPMIKRNGTGIDIRLADDSNVTSLNAGVITTGAAGVNGSLIFKRTSDATTVGTLSAFNSGGVTYQASYNLFNTGGAFIGATVGIQGSGATSATSSLIVQNSSAQKALEIKDNTTVDISDLTNPNTYVNINGTDKPDILKVRWGAGGSNYIGFGSNTANNPVINMGLAQISSHPGGNALWVTSAKFGNNTSGTQFEIFSSLTGTQTGNCLILTSAARGSATHHNPTSGVYNMVMVGGAVSNQYMDWNPSSGTATFNSLSITQQLNTSGSYSGIVRGLYYSPILTSVTGITHRAIETETGDVLFNTTSGSTTIGTATVNPNAKLEIVSTSKGFLPPRMTTAERDAVTWVTGDAGMMIFNTTLVKLQVWNGAAWETITSV